jgi:3-deoxy-D-manno-octulosonate 8-phosphate phosphatase (KDO 8-P phosphatase)
MKKLKHLNIKLLILDVDGVLTNGKIYISDQGIETKSFHTQDGLGLKLLLKNAIDIAVISGRKSKATVKRMRELGIKHTYYGTDDKIKSFNKLKKKLHLKNENIAYIGDDLPDLPVMQQVGFSIAVANAVPEVRQAADYVTKAKGGEGAVREACDLIRQFTNNIF